MADKKPLKRLAAEHERRLQAIFGSPLSKRDGAETSQVSMPDAAVKEIQEVLGSPLSDRSKKS